MVLQEGRLFRRRLDRRRTRRVEVQAFLPYSGACIISGLRQVEPSGLFKHTPDDAGSELDPNKSVGSLERSSIETGRKLMPNCIWAWCPREIPVSRTCKQCMVPGRYCCLLTRYLYWTRRFVHAHLAKEKRNHFDWASQPEIEQVNQKACWHCSHPSVDAVSEALWLGTLVSISNGALLFCFSAEHGFCTEILMRAIQELHRKALANANCIVMRNLLKEQLKYLCLTAWQRINCRCMSISTHTAIEKPVWMRSTRKSIHGSQFTWFSVEPALAARDWLTLAAVEIRQDLTRGSFTKSTA